MVDSSGNAPNSTSTHLVHYIFAEDVFTNLEQISYKEAMDISSKKNVPKQLTPVTIVVVAKFLPVKSRIFAEGFCWTQVQQQPWLIGNAFLGYAKHAKFSTVVFLIASYTSSEMVVLSNLRLSELDKAHNVDQHNNQATIEWFDNELPLRDTI